MEQSRTMILESLPEAHVTLGGMSYSANGGNEGPETQLNICVYAKLVAENNEAVENDETVDVVLSLTVPQMAKIVKQFFWGVTLEKKSIFANFLQRLLRKRWAVMTSPVYKHRDDLDEGYKVMRYAELD